MAKKTRIDRRGKIKPLVKRFPPVGRLHWKKQKLLTVLANIRQWQREFDPTTTPETEITTGEGWAIVIESSAPSLPTYIVIE